MPSMPECPEGLRRAMGVAGIAMMAAGSFPPLMGTPAGISLLAGSMFVTMLFFWVTFFDEVTLAGALMFGTFPLLLAPSVLWCLAYETEGVPATWRALSLMGMLIYFGCAYLGARALCARGPRPEPQSPAPKGGGR